MNCCGPLYKCNGQKKFNVFVMSSCFCRLFHIYNGTLLLRIIRLSIRRNSARDMDGSEPPMADTISSISESIPCRESQIKLLLSLFGEVSTCPLFWYFIS